MLDIKDMLTLMNSSKTMNKNVKAQDDIWRLKVFKQFEIKMGYEHIRKENFFKIDHLLSPLHKEALAELLRGKRKQRMWFVIWFLIFLFMAFLLFPVLLILDEEGIKIPMPVIFLPFTLWWVWLIAIAISFFHIARKTRQNVLYKICKDDEFSNIPVIRGRKYKHPAMWKYMHYLSKALSVFWYMFIFCYLGIFFKVYIL